MKKDALDYYGTDSFTDYFTNYTNADGEKLPCIIWGSYPTAIGTKPDDIKQKYAQINDYMYKQIFKMIYAENDAEYEALLQEAMDTLPTMGLNDVVEWYQTRVSELRGELDPMIDDAVKAYNVQ